MTKDVTTLSPWREMGFLVAITIVSLIVGGLISTIPAIASGIPRNDWGHIMSDPKYYNITIWMQGLSSIFCIGMPALLFAYILRKNIPEYFHLEAKSNPDVWLLVILIAIAGLSVSDLLAAVNEWIPLSKPLTRYFQQLENDYNSSVMAMMHFDSWKDLAVSIIVMALLPAIAEELFFRGALQNIIVRIVQKPLVGILITAAIFSAIHGSYYGFLPRFMLGIVLGYVFQYGKNIRLNMLIHFINNGIAVLGMYILAKEDKLNLINLNEHMEWYWQLGGTVAFIAIAYLLIKALQNQQEDMGGA